MSVRRDIIEKNTKDVTYMSKMYLVWTEISWDKYSIVYIEIEFELTLLTYKVFCARMCGVSFS